MRKRATVRTSVGIRTFVVVALASLALLIPAGMAQGARISKALAARIRHNLSVLRRRVRANPRSAQQGPVIAVPRRRGQTAPIGPGIAHESAVGGKGCTAAAAADFGRNNVPPNAPDAIKSGWANKSQCSGIPVLTLVTTDMIAPNGTHHKSSGANSITNPNNASLHGHANGPEGTWAMNNSVTWAVSPPLVWKTVQGLCAGEGTSVITCYYPKAYPVLAP